MKDLGGRFVRYGDRVYRSNLTSGSALVSLLAYGNDPPEAGFEQIKPGVWRKQVPRSDVAESFQIEYHCTYRSLDCVAAREDGGRVEILYLAGNSYAAAEAGLTEIDRGAFHAWVNRCELHNLHEVRMS